MAEKRVLCLPTANINE